MLQNHGVVISAIRFQSTQRYQPIRLSNLIDPRNIDIVLNRGRVSQIIVNIYDVTENGKRKVQEIFTKKDKGVKITYRTFLLKKDTEEWQEEPNDPTLENYDSNYDMIFSKKQHVV